MKKIILLVASLTIAVASATSIYAQDSAKDKKVAVFIDPLSMALGQYGGNVQIATGQKSHLDISGSVLNVEIPGFSNLTGWTVGLGYRFILGNGSALKGSYIGPAVQYWGVTSGSYSATAILFGAEVGRQWLFDVGFSIGARVGYLVGTIASSSGSTSQTLPVGGFTYGIDVGWAF